MSTPGKPLRALIVEDNQDDAWFLIRELRKSGYDVDYLRVENAQTLLLALTAQPWDIVYADYSLPGFTGLEALQCVRQVDLDIPFVFVSGTIGEDAAILAVRNGAQDYILKSNLKRLSSITQRELRETVARRERRAMEQSHARLAAIIEATPDLIALLAVDGRVLHLNTTGQQLLGINRTEKLETMFFEDWLCARSQGIWADVMSILVNQSTHWSGELSLHTETGEKIFSCVCFAHETATREAAVTLAVIARDISEQKRLEAQLYRMACHDSLTGLCNRYVLLDRLGVATQQAARENAQLAVIFIDLNNFKPINDRYGHRAGDILLKAVSEKLRHSVRPNDIVARYGGDEFIVVVEAISSDADVLAVTGKLAKLLEAPIQTDGAALHLTLSIGVALFPADAQGPEALINCADAAMYRAKKNAATLPQFYRDV